MKILYDEQTVLTQKIGGVSRYFVDLMSSMADMGAEVVCLLPGYKSLENSGNVYGLAVPGFFLKPSILWRGINYLSVKLYPSLFRKIMGVRHLFQFADVVHAGQFCYEQETLLCHPHLVTTVHDMIHENYFLKLEDVPNGAESYSRVKRSYVEHSAHIIAISEYTRKELIRLWNVPADKITVIYHANPFEEKKIPERTQKNGSYILYVGTRQHYKNFSRFAEAAAGILSEKSQFKVICAGHQPFTSEESQMLEQLGVADRFTIHTVTDAELVQLYVDAELFCFPSQMEGFGLPILEAFTCGCPVCCSNATCFPEVAGDAACYFNPESVDDMEAAMRRVLDDSEYREQLIAAGRQRAALFTREKTAEATLAVYRKCMTIS